VTVAGLLHRGNKALGAQHKKDRSDHLG
jgi:hypothetical protein